MRLDSGGQWRLRKYGISSSLQTCPTLAPPPRSSFSGFSEVEHDQLRFPPGFEVKKQVSIIVYHISLLRLVLHHVISHWHSVLLHITPRYVAARHGTSQYITLHHITPCRTYLENVIFFSVALLFVEYTSDKEPRLSRPEYKPCKE